MIYGIERTTDLRHPETVVKRFRSRRAAVEWARSGGGFAWPGAASEDLPDSQRNWHRRYRYIYEMPTGWRPPSRRQLVRQAAEVSTWGYPRHAEDVLASLIARHGEEIKP